MSDALETVKKYVPDADPAVVEKMASTYRLVLQKADAALVSASDPEELKTVRENFLKKKLGLTDSDAVLDKSISDVLAEMKDGKSNPRLARLLQTGRQARQAERLLVGRQPEQATPLPTPMSRRGRAISEVAHRLNTKRHFDGQCDSRGRKRRQIPGAMEN